MKLIYQCLDKLDRPTYVIAEDFGEAETIYRKWDDGDKPESIRAIGAAVTRKDVEDD